MSESTMPGGANAVLPELRNKKKPKINFDNGWETIRDIPIFDAHDGAKEEGIDINFTPEILKRIVDQCNHRIADSNDLCPVTNGHTSFDKDEQPELLGWAYNFKMGRIGRKNPRDCITVDMSFPKYEMLKVKKLPRRSVELWPDLIIDPIALTGSDRPAMDSIALLGSERPARDLGVMFKKEDSRIRYWREFTEETMANEELIAECIQQLMATPEMAYVKHVMGDNDNLDKEEVVHAPEATEKEPAAEECAAEHDEDCEPAKLRMQRDQERRKFSKLQADHKALFSKVEELERRERIADRRATLLGLEGEGYLFDMADEVEYVAELEPARYAKHLTKIRANYQKAPVGVFIKPAPVKVEGGLGEVVLTPDQVGERAIKLAQEKYGSTGK